MDLTTFSIVIIFLPCFFVLVLVSEALTRLAKRDIQMDDESHIDWPQGSLGNHRGRTSHLLEQCKQQLSIKQYKCGTGAEQQGEPVHCVFCLSDISEGEETIELRCRHTFHRVCLDTWLEHRWATCPICRDCLLPTEGKAAAAVSDEDEDELDEIRHALLSYFRENWRMW